MTMEPLDELQDAELRAVIARAEALLKRHDEERKTKALADAKAILSGAGLSVRNLTRNVSAAKPNSAKPPGRPQRRRKSS